MTESLLESWGGPKLNIKHGFIDLSHGSGGRAMAQLIEQIFLSAFDNEWLAQRNDQACFLVDAGRMVMTTDAFVISPLFFPGGDIGSLAVHGTINDIAMAGAKPRYLSASFILEEGFPLKELKQIVNSMALAAKEADVSIITGDTKVVERGKGDGVFISMTGIGFVPPGVSISGDKAEVGDHVLLSGYMGDHGVAVLSQRNNMQFFTSLISDSAPLHSLVADMIAAVPDLHCLRDPTRGGVATTLNEWARQSGVGFLINEDSVPVRQEVASACELLGLDPFYIANEGKLLAICAPEQSQRLLEVMRKHPLGKHAQMIGEVVHDPRHFVQLKTKFGGLRIMDWLTGEQLPRIC
ncbi:hydrogenase expression/formation protein HypE [Legionella jordanis]|uniref:hydrogenase expression/formation protein HypE n=1 Tax=Legionella jordanis TaxID=456 RepID=UPI000EFF807E|nr:hydrogenase expression/formation protein HypE [Legionella jordanis]RMX15129.1 hydrogenase expression/formation protein HypE [Legionella jordanis]